MCADTGNLKGMYDGIKQAIGPMQSQIAPLKSATGDAVKDKTKQMECWVKHYSEFYSRVNVVSEEELMAMESLSIMDELDSEPTLEEINQALDQLSSVRPPEMMPYLLKSLSVQKEHSSRNYMRYFANAGEKVRFHRT